MNYRESFRATMHFEQCEHLFWHEAVPDETALQWVREGLPLKKALSEHTTELSRRGAMVSVPAKRIFDVSRYFGFSNLLIVIQIEHIEGVRNINEIVQVEGIDAIFMGWADLGGSMGMYDGGEVRAEIWRESWIRSLPQLRKLTSLWGSLQHLQR